MDSDRNHWERGGRAPTTREPVGSLGLNQGYKVWLGVLV